MWDQQFKLITGRRMHRTALPVCLVVSTALSLVAGCAATGTLVPPPSTAIFHHHMASSPSATSPGRQPLPDTTDPGVIFRTALDAFTAGDHERAAALVRGVIEQYPDSPWKRRSR